MEKDRTSLPEQPSGFEDYLAAACQLVYDTINNPAPDLFNIEGLVDETSIASDALATLDEILARDLGDPMSGQLSYSLAYQLFMKDTSTNSADGYSDMLDVISTISQFEAEYAASPESQEIVKIDQLLVNTVTALAEVVVADAVESARKTVRNDTRLRRMIRRALVYLGIKDVEEVVEYQYYDQDDVPQWLLKSRLQDLALAREKLLSRQTAKDNEEMLSASLDPSVELN